MTDVDTLVVLTPGFAENESDTTCLPFLQGHISALGKNFPRLEIIILAFQYPYVKGIYKWNGIEVVSFDGRNRGKIYKLWLWVQVWRKLLELKRTKKIIGLFSLWCTECALIGSHFGKLYKLKHYTWLCGQDAKAGNKYVKYIRPRSEELIAMSDFLKREFYKNYKILPAHVIPLGVSPEQFLKDQQIRNIDLLGVGSLIPLKQYDVFIKVINELHAGFPEINAMIYGKGPEEEKLNKMITDLRIQKNITLAGEIPHSEVLKSMQQAKIFLHTSNYEGFGTVCLEALYAGAHVVSFTKPMDIDIPHWHHVSNIEEMGNKVYALLSDFQISHQLVCPFSSDDIAVSMMKLFCS